jgi:hypothetical protein
MHNRREAPGHLTPKVPYLLSDEVVSRIRLKDPNPPSTSPRISEPEYVKPEVARRHRSPLRNGFTSTRLSKSPVGSRYVSPRPISQDDSTEGQGNQARTSGYKADRLFVASPPQRVAQREHGGDNSDSSFNNVSANNVNRPRTGHGQISDTGQTRPRQSAGAILLSNISKPEPQNSGDVQQIAGSDGGNENQEDRSPSSGGLLHGIQSTLVKMDEKQHISDDYAEQRGLIGEVGP